MAERLKISKVLEQNTEPSQSTEKTETGNSVLHPLKMALAGLSAGLVETAPMALGFFSNLPKVAGKALAYPFKKDMEPIEILEPFANSKLINLGDKGGDFTRKLFGIDDLSKLSRNEQIAYTAGDFAPVFATFGSSGLVKVGAGVAKVGGRAAVKTFAKKGASYAAKKALYKKGVTAADTLTNIMLPGVQVTKKASIPAKTFQIAAQTTPELVSNELMHLNAENEGIFGDYSSKTPEELTLIKDKRKIGKKEYLDQLNPSVYEQYKINEQIEKEKKAKILQNTLVISTLLGAGALTARYTGYGAKLSQKIKDNLINSAGYDSLSPETKLDFAVANRYAFMDDLVKRGIIPEEQRNALYRDYNVIVNRAWEEGKITLDNLDIDLGVKPKELYDKINRLTQLSPEEAEAFNRFIENARWIQDEAYKESKALEKSGVNVDNYTVNDFTNRIIHTDIRDLDKTGLVGIYSRILSNARYTTDVFNGNSNPLIKEILTDLSTLNNNMLDYYGKRNYFSAQQIAQMKHNRTMNMLRVKEFDNGRKEFDTVYSPTEVNTPISLNLYKQAVSSPETGLLSRFKHYINKASYSDNSLGYLSSVTPRNSTANMKATEDLINVLEQTIKSNIYNVEKNHNLRTVLNSYAENNMKQIADYIDKNIDYAQELFEKTRSFDKQGNVHFDTDALKDYTDFIQDTTKYVVKHLEAKYLGSKELVSTVDTPSGLKSADVKQRLLDQLNHPDAKDSVLVNEIKKFDFGNEYSETADTHERNGIIRVVDNGELKVYQVDPLYAKALTLEPTISNVVGRGFYLLKNFQQSMLTGKFNPFFSGRSAIYTAHEAITVLPKLAKDLELGKIRRLDYIKECFKNIKNLYAEEKAKYLAKQYDTLANNPIMNVDLTTGSKKNIKAKLANISSMNAMKERLTQVLQANADNPDLNLIHLMQDGGATQNKPYNTGNERVVVLNNKTKITPKLQGILEKIHTPKGAKQIINIIDMMQNVLRDAPALSVNTLLYKRLKGKLPVDITTGKIKMDQKMLDKLAYTINTQVANSSLYGAGNGALGSLSEFLRNYFSYGSITINSIAPKLRAMGLGKGIKNTRELILKVIDKNTSYSDILDHMGMMARSAKGNEYLKSLIYVSVIPSIISYIWNHGSQDNINSYYSYSDSNKGSKFILTNVFGKGVHLVIPKDQELALSDAIVYAVLDNALHLSKYNPNDPNFKASQIVGEAMARSIGLDGNPTLNLFANAQGYNISANVFDDRFGITKLGKNVINNDLTQTAYQNGWANQEVTNIVNNIFGTLGSALLLSAEEAKVGARKGLGTAATDATLAFLDRTFGNSSFVPLNFDKTRSTSGTTQTVQDVYKTRNLLEQISIIKDKTPEQMQIYELIKMYNRNRIEPIKKQITQLRQDITQVRANGRTTDGQLHSYYSRRNNVNELNNQLKELFKNEYNEYNKLDNLIKQEYGNDVSLENFMAKFSNIGSN